MFLIDFKRPFKASVVRLREAGFFPWLFSCFGLFATRNQKLERAIRVAQKQARSPRASPSSPARNKSFSSGTSCTAL